MLPQEHNYLDSDRANLANSAPQTPMRMQQTLLSITPNPAKRNAVASYTLCEKEIDRREKNPNRYRYQT